MSPICLIKYYILGIADNVHKQICDTKKKYAAIECNTSHFNFLYIYMSPKLEIHRRGPPPQNKTYFLHKYHRCPKEVNIIKEGFPANIVQNNII